MATTSLSIDPLLRNDREISYDNTACARQHIRNTVTDTAVMEAPSYRNGVSMLSVQRLHKKGQLLAILINKNRLMPTLR
jgi:hypothetical protein